MNDQGQTPGGPLLEHFGIGVAKAAWDATVRFYQDTLGMETIAAGTGSKRLEGGAYAFLRHHSNPTVIALLRMECEAMQAPHHIGFNVPSDEWDATLSRFAGVGVRPIEEGLGRADAQWVYMLDPAGNMIQLIRGRRSMAG